MYKKFKRGPLSMCWACELNFMCNYLENPAENTNEELVYVGGLA